jgi:hypothetical protein
MKSVKVITSLVVLLFASFVMFGQNAKSDYLDSIKQVELERRSAKAMEYQLKLETVNEYNQEVDMNIQNKVYVVHRLNLNANNNPIPKIGKYNQNIMLYFQNEGGAQNLKKIIVMTTQEDNMAYQEFLFNQDNSVYKATSMPDMSKPATAKAFYYEQEKLVMFTKNGGQVYGADDVDTFDEDAFKEGVDWLNKAANYQAMFKIMKSIEPSSAQ